MTHQRMIRCGIALSASLLVAGCFGGGPGQSDMAGVGEITCRWMPSSCIHEGSYEPGERAYAEDEARRLNQAQLDRLRHSGG